MGAAVTATLFGMYAFATSIVLRASIIFLAVYVAALPALTSMLSQGRHADLRRQYTVVNDLQMTAAAVIFSSLPFANSVLLARVFGASSSIDAIWLPVLLTSFALFMQAAMGTLLTLAMAHGTPTLIPRAFAIALCISLPVGWVCIRLFGIAGGGVTVALFMVVQCALMVPRLSGLYLGSSTAWFRSFGRLGLCWSASLGVGLAVQHGLHLAFVSTALSLLAGCALFLLASFRWTFHDETRDFLRGVSVRRGLRRASNPPMGRLTGNLSMGEASSAFPIDAASSEEAVPGVVSAAHDTAAP